MPLAALLVSGQVCGALIAPPNSCAGAQSPHRSSHPPGIYLGSVKLFHARKYTIGVSREKRKRMRRGKSNVVIVGGGIIGCPLAYILRKCRRGACVCDQGAISAWASRGASSLLALLKPFARPQDPYMHLLFAGPASFVSFLSEVEA